MGLSCETIYVIYPPNFDLPIPTPPIRPITIQYSPGSIAYQLKKSKALLSLQCFKILQLLTDLLFLHSVCGCQMYVQAMSLFPQIPERRQINACTYISEVLLQNSDALLFVISGIRSQITPLKTNILEGESKRYRFSGHSKPPWGD